MIGPGLSVWSTPNSVKSWCKNGDIQNQCQTFI